MKHLTICNRLETVQVNHTNHDIQLQVDPLSPVTKNIFFRSFDTNLCIHPSAMEVERTIYLSLPVFRSWMQDDTLGHFLRFQAMSSLLSRSITIWHWGHCTQLGSI